jgi:hypothetical protein
VQKQRRAQTYCERKVLRRVRSNGSGEADGRTGPVSQAAGSNSYSNSSVRVLAGRAAYLGALGRSTHPSTDVPMTRSLLAIAFILLGQTGCNDLFGPEPPSGAVPLTPIPAEYAGWWALTARCSGSNVNFQDVTWSVYPGATIPGTYGAVGAWYSRTRTIVLAQGQENNGPLVRHEMLHALVNRRGHSRVDFVDRCGGVVSCEGRCLVDVGGAVSRDLYAPIVNMNVLRVSVDLEPRVVSLSTATEGCVTVVVAARNSSSVPVRVQLEGHSPIANQSFGWRLEGYRGGGATVDGSLMPFNGGETRRHVFECVYVGPVRNWPSPGPGNYTMTGHIRSLADSTRFTVIE